MNEATPPWASPTGIPVQRKTSVPPPRRLRFPDPDRCGIVLGRDPSHVRVARVWAHQIARTTRNAAFPLVTAVSELVTNAQRHTRSGDPGGTTTVVVERRPYAFVLTVADDGPRPGPTIPVPRIEEGDSLRGGGFGLRLVDALCAYWDWSGTAGGPLTVRALIERDTAPRLPPVA
ncbi:serine/threonine protein kinase [Nocardiopsis sp. CNR-923]|uniref:ATP-binding protein n=1 Tax=Nocardiopsis sp. CNR-923 TaxID=1904965 RepID=UPI000967826F|nr:ATP-binding protein [Nocardiopsis sp. CNR-923]OLT26507.1 serine/threonine protein kinase [Nocardiopsis sp. CNR-923]